MIENGNEKFNMLYGCDETLLCGLVLGAKAAVGSTYNYFSPVYHKLWEAFNNGDLEEARNMKRLSVKIVALVKKYGGAVVCGKSIMNLLGMNLGPCRLPIRNLDSSEIDQLKKDLEEMHFFNPKELMQTI
ncbi:MAG: dihydrodipicolinate synthase family protein [Bacteroidales bacterium]|nr:dihydrodipicolinate synthase family protein [Bacteroidales bacterium]